MDIIKEQLDDLNAVIRVKLTPLDYQSKYETSIRTYTKKAVIKGFRPGHVPVAMIKKMYGKAILAEEINKLLNDTLYGYISENKIEILGNPLPKEDEKNIQFNENSDMEFAYEIGLAPKIDLNLSNEKVEYNTLRVDDELIKKQMTDLARRYGKMMSAEVSEPTDMLFGTFVELDDKNEIKEGGILHNSTISIEYLHDEELKKKLSGLKPGDNLTIDPKKVSHSLADMASMLGIDKERAKTIHTDFKFSVNEIKRIMPAEFNQELFDKLFGESVVTSEEDFMVRVSDDLKNMFTFDSDRLFFRKITEKLIDNVNVSLPDDFLKRWIVSTNEKPVTYEQVEAEYLGYSRGLKWQLIENKIIRENNLKVSNEEALAYTKNYLNSQYARYGMPPMEDEKITESATRILANKDEQKKIYDELYNRKVLEYLKHSVTLDPKELSYDEFMKLIGQGNEHVHDHDHDHDHDHECDENCDHDHEHEHHHHH